MNSPHLLVFLMIWKFCLKNKILCSLVVGVLWAPVLIRTEHNRLVVDKVFL